MKPEVFQLVYQCGIANVFKQINPLARGLRVLQASYRDCEMFIAGAREAGARTEVFHCDRAGDVAQMDWDEGSGELWADGKHPPITWP
jgi:hypothetical protein